MTRDQLNKYIKDRLKNDGDARDAYYNSTEDKWAVVATDGGCPRGYEYMGTYTCNNGTVTFEPR